MEMPPAGSLASNCVEFCVELGLSVTLVTPDAVVALSLFLDCVGVDDDCGACVLAGPEDWAESDALG